MAPLQKVLNPAARTVLDMRPGDHVTPALRELHWLRVTVRIKYKICVQRTGSQSGGRSRTQVHCWHTDAGNITLRSVCAPNVYNGDFAVRRPRLIIGERAFSIAAPRVWNRPSYRQSWNCADQRRCSSANWKCFCLLYHMECLKQQFLNCYAPSVNL